MNDFYSKEKIKERSDARKFMYVDLGFILLPFILLLIIQSYKKTLNLLWENTDWAIAATILSGQTLVRYYSGLSKYQGKKNISGVSIWGFLLLVLTIFCVVVFVILQIGQGHLLIFQILQIFLFLISIRISLVFGSIGQLLSELGRDRY